ncbi:E3 ubiquitin-protein ligase ATL9-like [Zingiber officinale]|uniref:E3 ubiquitin-protein ligase ATL9-like n=1 Tax=Zingiber officinale TaxID=94328 RepID=UPI001C4D94E8|nr:E3 ubiquitin-protein ligase ATL9-like [Zingiber officinale]
MESSFSFSSHPRFPPTTAAAPQYPTSSIDEALPQICLLVLSFLIVGALLSVSFGSGLEEEQENLARRMMEKKKKQGLSPETVTSFLLVPFGAAGWGREEAGECAVCLAEFGCDDTLRVLPRCGHGYHAECIDPWLLRHATCPLCRNDLASLPAIAPGRRHVIDVPHDL